MNNPLFALPATKASSDWLIFTVMLLAIGIGIGCYVIYLMVIRNSTTGKKAKERKKLRHHRPRNPSRAETGGLPPPRDPDEPPAGP
jgi:hypothetical protein